MKGIIATWAMAMEGVKAGRWLLDRDAKSGEALQRVIRTVEDDPTFTSVGYGGLPNQEQDVELDSGFMDGDTLSVGAVCGIRDVANPISVAARLSSEPLNNVLIQAGAEKYAQQHGFARKNMLTERASAIYMRKIAAGQAAPQGHDTVGVVCLDGRSTITAATSTSGLFMKARGRIGDSPLVGCGYYADSQVGGAAATGVGEDIMKGCTSYEIVRRMRDGMTPQQACESTVWQLTAQLRQRAGQARDISVIAMDRNGDYGAATNIAGPDDVFSFCLSTEEMEPAIYLVRLRDGGHCVIEPASQAWIDAYLRHQAGLDD